MNIKLNKNLKQGKAMFLAYDHGLEHGPSDFHDKDADPNYIIDIAKKGKYNAVIFQKGIAEKYNDKIKKSKVPLIIKLNGKTNLFGGEAVSRQICSVKEAIKLGASAVGYTIYIGSKYESVMMKEFDAIEEYSENSDPINKRVCSGRTHPNVKSLDRAIEKAETQGGIPLEGAEYLGNSFKVNVECAIALNPTKGEINEKVIRVNKKKIDISDKSRRTIF